MTTSFDEAVDEAPATATQELPQDPEAADTERVGLHRDAFKWYREQLTAVMFALKDLPTALPVSRFAWRLDPGTPTPDISLVNPIAFYNHQATMRAGEFKELAAEWREKCPPGADSREMYAVEAYQRIIGFGRAAVPLILAELERELDHWFWALYCITGAKPVKRENRGVLEKMAEDWIQWGRNQGYRW